MVKHLQWLKALIVWCCSGTLCVRELNPAQVFVLHCKFLCLKNSVTLNYNFFSRSTIRIPSRQHEKGLIQLMRQKGNQTVIVLNFWWFVSKAEEKDFWRLKKFFFSPSSGKRMEEKNNCSWSNFFSSLNDFQKISRIRKRDFRNKGGEKREWKSLFRLFLANVS